MYIAVDFDGTLVTNEFPSVGKEVQLAVETVKYLISKGHKIILHTCRTHNNHDGHDCLSEAEQWCRDRGIELYAVNDNPENRKYWGSQEPIDKVYADVYIDDHSFGMPLTDNHVDWSAILMHFKALYGDLTDKEEITPSKETSSLMDDYVTALCDDLTKPKIVEISCEKEKANNAGAVSD